MSICIISDTTSYIDLELQKELDIKLIPLSVHFPDESFQEDQVDYDYFYDKINKGGAIPTSSQPSAWEFQTMFKEIIEAGDDIVAIFISSEMSGTFINAYSAKMELLEEFPDAKIEIIDSRTNCMALGLIVLEAARAAKTNASFDEVVAAAVHARNCVSFCFTPKTLDFLIKGGRIGTASALIGKLLDISPVLTVDMEKGMTHLLTKARGFTKALTKLYEALDKDYTKNGLKTVYIHHISAKEEAEKTKEIIAEKYPDVPVHICSIGPVIGTHVGPGTIGIAYCTQKPIHDLASETN
ncbi:MAG: DegV family protein [Oscillospiraceae bacterium]|nr:DegV family protein [Oscillospiraceae bacterium]